MSMEKKQVVVSKPKSPAERIKADRGTIAASPVAGVAVTPSAPITITMEKNVEVASQGLEELNRCPLGLVTSFRSLVFDPLAGSE